MTQSKERAIWTLSIWGAVVVIFLPVFFLMGGGASDYAKGPVRIALSALLFAAGWMTYFVMMARTRTRPDHIMGDERDEHIAWRSNGAALVAVLVYVYSVAITLWILYQDPGSVPAGWMWLIGYSAIFYGYISHALAALVLNNRMGADAKS